VRPATPSIWREAPSPAAGFEEAGVDAIVLAAPSPYHTSLYVNFLMDEGEERIRQAYGAKKSERLKSLKRKYDKTNFPRLNQNISPDYN
jgi:hypothetical protein